MVWMTAVLSMEQKAAQGVNLLYFLPAGLTALPAHLKNGYVEKGLPPLRGLRADLSYQKQADRLARSLASSPRRQCLCRGRRDAGPECGRGTAAEAIRRVSCSGWIVGGFSEGTEKGIASTRAGALLCSLRQLPLCPRNPLAMGAFSSVTDCAPRRSSRWRERCRGRAARPAGWQPLMRSGRRGSGRRGKWPQCDCRFL